MKTRQMIMDAYEAPKVEVFEVEVENGFSISSNPDDWNYGGNPF